VRRSAAGVISRRICPKNVQMGAVARYRLRIRQSGSRDRVGRAVRRNCCAGSPSRIARHVMGTAWGGTRKGFRPFRLARRAMCCSWGARVLVRMLRIPNISVVPACTRSHTWPRVLVRILGRISSPAAQRGATARGYSKGLQQGATARGYSKGLQANPESGFRILPPSKEGGRRIRFG
jgi:hypothetical protein